MKVHEFVLEDNPVRIYLGKVTKVSRSEMPPVTDFVGNTLSPLEILFSVGTVITNARATPIDQTNEVKEGDFVIVFSLENIYNTTYFYHSLRYLSQDNDSIYMRYGESEIKLIPKDPSITELVLAGGTSVIHLEPGLRKINIESDYGGVNINSHSGYINISNNNTSLKKILDDLMDALMNLKILTISGPAPVTPGSFRELSKINLEISKLFSDLDSSYLYPNLPSDTYSVEFASEAVSTLGLEFLNDDGDPEPGSVITNLQNSFTEPANNNSIDESAKLVESIKPIVRESSIPENIDEDLGLNEDIQLSQNFRLSQLTTKATFPHRLKSQHNLSKEEIIKNLKVLATNVLEPIYAKYPKMKITSGFRGVPSLKNRVSQHEIGEAVDIQFPGMSPKDYLEASEWIVKNVAFDQFIFEHGVSIWFHISCKRKGSNRGALLTMFQKKYSSGITLHYK